MNRNLVMAAVAGIASLVAANVASAGGIVVDLREPAQYRAALPSDVFLAFNQSNSGNGAGTGTSGDGSGDSPEMRKKLPKPLYLEAAEIAQVQQGLITPEEAMSGCGGASAAAGPAGILPLAVAGLALLRRRR